jgi:hypothetical protein
MARRFLEAFLDKSGFSGKTLGQRIDAAKEAGKLKDLTYQLASAARIIGNYGAHYSDDLLAQIGESEALLVLEMVRKIVSEVPTR